MYKITELDPTGKQVVVRVDWNVTLGKALEIVDATRIERTLPTIKWLLEQGVGQVVLIAHLGKYGEERSLREVAEYGGKLLGEEIAFWETVEQCRDDTESRVIMLENLRMWEGEDKNDTEFAKSLASLGEIYVNEAFGECHRKSASIVGIPKIIRGYAGFNLVKEVETLLVVRDNPARPLVVVMGGAKVEDKLKLLEEMSKRADTLLLGGKLANEFVQQKIKLTGRAKVVTPVEGAELLDIGEGTRRIFAKEIMNAKTVVWNGPMGKVEDVEHKAGTQAVYEELVQNRDAYTVVGGGDTLASIRDEKHLERIDFVSTGGGAMLSLLEKGTLPGTQALEWAR